jgi:hypothetical protein
MARRGSATKLDDDDIADLEITGTSSLRPELEDGEEYKRIPKWEELADEGAAVLFTVVDPEGPAIDFGNGDQVPVVARVIVLTGEDAGEVYEFQLVIKGGLKNKLKDQRAGAHVVGRVGWYEIPGRRDSYIGLEDEKRSDIALAKKALAKFGKVDMDAYDPDALRDEVEEALEAKNNGKSSKAKSSRGSSNGRSSSRGKGRGNVDDDDEPPF